MTLTRGARAAISVAIGLLAIAGLALAHPGHGPPGHGPMGRGGGGPMMMQPQMPMGHGPHGHMMRRGGMHHGYMPHGQGYRGHGMMMSPHGGMGMGPGAGHGWHWQGDGDGQAADLTVANVRRYFERRLAWQGYSRLKVGKVEEKDDKVLAEIVTVDGSLVQRYAVDRRTGAITHVN